MQATQAAVGFADPVIEAQAVFRTVMMAMARPGTVSALARGPRPPAPLTPAMAAIALALCDHETPIWLDETLAAVSAVAAYLRFHSGLPIVARTDAATFALATNLMLLPPLAEFAAGSDEYPDRSTTIVVAVDRLDAGPGLVLEGPGIDGRASLSVEPLPERLVAELQGNRERFPRGVDLILVAGDKIAALPRSTQVVEA